MFDFLYFVTNHTWYYIIKSLQGRALHGVTAYAVISIGFVYIKPLTLSKRLKMPPLHFKGISFFSLIFGTNSYRDS